MRTLLPLLLLASLACKSSDMSDDEREHFLDIHIETAGAYLSMGDYGRAIDQAIRGLEIEPENFKLRLYLARGLQKTGRTGDMIKAEQVFRGMSRAEDYRVALGLAETIERRGVAESEAAEGIRSGRRFTQAPDPAVRADELEADASASWWESIDLYGEALTLAPDDTEILNGMVRANTLLGEFEAALSWGARVIGVTESERSWWKEALKRPGMSPREEAACRRSIDHLDRLETSVHLNSYTILAGAKSHETALGHLDHAAELDPGNNAIYSRRAELLVKLGRHAEALAAIEKFLSLTDLNFESEGVRRAFQLRSACQSAIASN